VPRLYHRLSGLLEPVYRRHGLTVGKRSLLQDLARCGPHTIAQMVRQRPPVTRQYIQRLVAEMAAAGLVAVGPDARDRRARTVRLTEAGSVLMAALVAEERAIIARLAAGSDPADLAAALAILAGILTRIEQGGPLP
jgi:DNA-binding MarR family transcriptional regulator